MNIHETDLNDALLTRLIALSARWEREDSCYGYRTNDRSDIEGSRIFVAEENGEVIGYLLRKESSSQNSTSIMADGTPYFEIEELYIIPSRRGQGIGSALYWEAENAAMRDGLQYVMLSTAAKDFRRILHFYIDEMGMEFWSARLFKKIG